MKQKRITHPQGKEINQGANHFVTWLDINSIKDNSQSDQMRLYRSIWNSAWNHAKRTGDD